MNDDEQLGLFGEAQAPRVPAAPRDDALVDVARRMPARVRLGTSSWSFPGWKGVVWARDHDETTLSRHGLPAYAAFPLFRTVSVDRGHYQPLPVSTLRAYASQVPDDFRFVVKAHESTTLHTFPSHPRYGEHRGRPSPQFLDAAWATDHVVAPFVEGLGPKGGALLFQMAAQNVDALGGPHGFAARLHAFLRALPRGPLYALEVRNAALLTPALSAALDDAGAVPCVSAIDAMPHLSDQLERLGGPSRRALVVRWQLRRGLTYEAALQRYHPFTRIVDVDDDACGFIADLCRSLPDTPALVLVNNKAEGSAPLSVARLARRLAA